MKEITRHKYPIHRLRLHTCAISGDATNMSYQYTYDASTRLLTQLNLTNADGNNANYTYSYDNYKRLLSTVEDNTYARFTKTLEYDMFGKVFSETSEAKNKANNKVAQKTLLFEYMSGEVFALHDGQTGQVIHQSIGLNERGQPTASYFEGGQRLINTYDQYGYIQQSQLERYMNNPSVLMTLGYTFNTSRGLLTNRSNSAFSWNESFAYDSQDRLTNFNDNHGNNSHIYDNKGRITNNSQLGDYTYNNYQQTQLNNLVSTAHSWYQDRALQRINYNAFKSPVEINEEGKERISFQYNAGLQRAHMYYGSDATEKMDRPYRRHYSEDGTMEITEDIQNGTTNFVFYLGGDAYSAPAIWKEIHHSNAQPLDAQLYFLHRDHLGSIVMITDAAGNIAEKRQFDAWGNLVKLENGNSVPLTAFVILDRGYTGHEHLLGVGLIHMNGRLYDPKLHRFLQPDNYVQDPYNSQNYNRYGYVYNNPLSHVDPSGEVAWFVPMLVIMAKGAAIAGVSYTASVAFSDGGFKNWNWGQFAKSLGIGAVSGVFTAGIGSAFGEVGKFGHEVARGLSHGFVNGTISSVTGGDFMQGFASGALGSLAGSGFQALDADLAKSFAGTVGFSAVAGGVGAELTGGDFWRGAAVGATVGALNHMGKHLGDNIGKIKYKGGTVQNYESAEYGPYAVFTDNKGVETYFPGVHFHDGMVLEGTGMTLSNGSIFITNGYGLDGLQHEYGHYLVAQNKGHLMYNFVDVPKSFFSALFSSNHYTTSTEIAANRAAINFFGPKSAIALTPKWIR